MSVQYPDHGPTALPCSARARHRYVVSGWSRFSGTREPLIPSAAYDPPVVGASMFTMAAPEVVSTTNR